MKKVAYLLFTIILATAGISFAQTPPNIILVISDDLGYPYYGFNGNTIVKTPTLDQLANESTVFTNGFSTASVCRPALQTLLTGVHPTVFSKHIEDMETFLGHSIDYPNDILYFQTIARQLSRVGYRSYEGGKLWEGSAGMAGFDDGTQADISQCPDIGSNCRDEYLGWGTFGRTSIQDMWDFIDESSQPFFIWFAPKLPHAPMDAPSNPFYCPYWPEAWQIGANCNPIYPEPDPPLNGDAIAYYANITRFDAVLNELLTGLGTRELRQDTLIIYVTDNGYKQEPYDECPLGPGFGCDKGKMSIYDLGFKTPIIFNWPNHIPSSTERNEIISFEDVYATIISYAESSLPVDRRGIDLQPLIQTGTGNHRDEICGSDPQGYIGELQYYARDYDLRYIWKPGPPIVEELYDITVDPYEESNIGPFHPWQLLAGYLMITDWAENLVASKTAFRVSGKVLDPDGEPLSNVRVNLYGPIPWTVDYTANDGSFVFTNIPANNYQVKVSGVHNLKYDGQLLENYRLNIYLNNQVLGPHLIFEAEVW